MVESLCFSNSGVGVLGSRPASPPTQSPKRERGFYEGVIRAWRCEAILQGLTDSETLLLAAQFAGLAVAACPGTPAEHEAQIDIACRALRTAYVGRQAVKEGFGFPMTPPMEKRPS